MGWPMVKGFFVNGTADLLEEEEEQLHKLVDSGKPMVFDNGAPLPDKDRPATWGTSSPWQPNLGVVIGKRVYEVSFVNNMQEMFDKGMLGATTAPHKFTTVSCISGCDQ